MSYARVAAGVAAGPAVWPAPPVVAPRPGWAPAPLAARYTEAEARRDGRLLDHRALVLVVAAIGLGGLIQLVAVALSHITSIEPEALIRYDIVLTVGMYAIVAAMIVSQITPSVRLRWGEGALAGRIGLGACVGVGISLALLGLVYVIAGHVQSDPRIVLLMSEGDPTHIIATVFIGCVAAPLVEETLFRGLLLESLRPRGKAVAVVGSAGAFAVWHFMPASLIYYAALGAVLGGLYLKRGLACSIAAHVGFNAVLTVAAISIVLGPARTIEVGGLNLTAPSGWSVASMSAGETFPGVGMLLGPDDAQLEVVHAQVARQLSPDEVATRLRSGTLALPPGLELDSSSVTETSSPAGEVVEDGLTVEGRQGEVAFLQAGGQGYELVFLSAGSNRAQRDFQAMLGSLQVA